MFAQRMLVQRNLRSSLWKPIQSSRSLLQYLCGTEYEAHEQGNGEHSKTQPKLDYSLLIRFWEMPEELNQPEKIFDPNYLRFDPEKSDRFCDYVASHFEQSEYVYVADMQ